MGPEGSTPLAEPATEVPISASTMDGGTRSWRLAVSFANAIGIEESAGKAQRKTGEETKGEETKRNNTFSRKKNKNNVCYLESR